MTITSKFDRAVIRAFTEQKALMGRKLSTNGKRLDGHWMGGGNIAEWKGGKIVFHDLGSKSAQTVQRAVRREAAPNDVARSPDSVKKTTSPKNVVSSKRPCKLHKGTHNYVRHSCGHEFCPHYWAACPRCYGTDSMRSKSRRDPAEGSWTPPTYRQSKSFEERVLKDPRYAVRHKFPKWNIAPTVLQEPRLFPRVFPELTKADHLRLARHFEALARKLSTQHHKALERGRIAYGTHGSLISGGFREHWAESSKEVIRRLAHGATIAADASRAHAKAAKLRNVRP